MSWKNVLVGVIAYVLGNIVFAIGFLTGVAHSSAPVEALLDYALLSVYTVGAIPGVTATAIYFVSIWIMRRWRLLHAWLPAMLITLALTFVLPIAVTMLVYPKVWQAEMICAFCKDPTTPVLMRDNNGWVIGRFPQGTEAAVKGNPKAGGTSYLEVTVTDEAGKTSTGVVMKRYLRRLK